MKKRLILINLFSLSFFFVEKYIIIPHKKLDFIEMVDPFLKQEVKQIENINKQYVTVSAHRRIEVYNEIKQRMIWNNHQIKEILFLNINAQVMNDLKNLLSIEEPNKKLMYFIMNNKSKSNKSSSLLINNKLYTLQPIELFGLILYLVVQWNFILIPFGFYMMLLIGILSCIIFIISFYKKNKMKIKLNELTNKVSDRFQKTEEDKKKYISIFKDDISFQNSVLDKNSLIFENFDKNDKNYLLIDPVLTEYREKAKEYSKMHVTSATTIRSKIFNPEVKDLIQQIAHEIPSLTKGYLEQLNHLQGIFNNLKRKTKILFLDKIYLKRPSTKKLAEKLKDCLQYLAQDFHSDFCIYLNYNFFINSYEPIAEFGMVNEAWKNFYILKKDPLISIDGTQDNLLRIDKALKINPYFMKRLNQKIASEIEWIYFTTLDPSDTNVIMAFFYKKAYNESQIKKFKKNTQDKLNNFAPLFRRMIPNNTIKRLEIYDRLILELKEMIMSGVYTLKVLHIYLTQPFSFDQFENSSNLIKDCFIESERFFYVSPMHFIVYLSSSDLDHVITKLKPIVGELKYKVYDYPAKSAILDYYLL